MNYMYTLVSTYIVHVHTHTIHSHLRFIFPHTNPNVFKIDFMINELCWYHRRNRQWRHHLNGMCLMLTTYVCILTIVDIRLPGRPGRRVYTSAGTDLHMHKFHKVMFKCRIYILPCT